jgi:hypothetical protein
MPNLDPWINQNNSSKNEEHMVATKTVNKFENHLLYIKDEHQKRIRPNLYPTYNERHEKIIELIDWILDKYKETATANIKTKTNRMENKK